uniref:lysozyme n=1 Tax=Meloidogyne incognita TaxID=6306 RepID=A0A914KPU0_MELIC
MFALKALIPFMLFVLIKSQKAPVPNKKCLDCICFVESQCKPLPCKWDDDAVSCGYLQIKLNYYKDCGTPDLKKGEKVEDGWKRCALNKSCAYKCNDSYKNYMNRYFSLCKRPNASVCEKWSRIHNGGPNGCTAARTDLYWDKIKKCGAN